MARRIEQLDLEQDTGSPRKARRFVAIVLTSWGVSSDAVETSQLLASELVSNAVLHGRAPINMSVLTEDADDRVVRVEVCNEGSGVPTRRVAGDLDPSGRGLQLIADLAARWGITNDQGQTRVWFEVGV